MFVYLQEFAKRPFNPEMNLGGWALFTLLILILVGFWASILTLITKGGD